MATEDARVIRRITQRLKSYTYYNHYCGMCGKHLCCIARRLDMICWLCYITHKVPTKKRLVLVQETNVPS